jgi:hypothetical protein
MIDIKFMSIEHLKVGFNNFPTIYLKVTKRKVTKRKVTKRKVTKRNRHIYLNLKLKTKMETPKPQNIILFIKNKIRRK